MKHLALLMLVLAAAPLSATLSNHNALNTLIEQEWQYRLQDEPEYATSVGDNRFNDRLTDYSAAAFVRRAAHDRAALAKFKAFNPSGPKSAGLTSDDRLNLALIMQRLEVDVDGQRFKNWEMPANQMNGPHLNYAGLSRDMPFNTAADYENYDKRLRALKQVFAQVTANMRLGLRDGLMPPEYLLDKVASESQEIAGEPLDQSSFTEPLRRFPAALTPTDEKRLSAEINATVSDLVLPAYANFAKFVREDYAPHGRTECGIWSLPDGAARYRHDILEQTTTNMAPGELHALGLEQVEQIDAQMLAIAKSQGFSDLKSFNRRLSTDKSHFATSGAQILALYQKYTDQMYLKLPLYFGRLPKNKLIVTPMEEYRAPHAVPADYGIGAGDGSRPGRINVNEYNPAQRSLLNIEAIAYHEGIPGHHLQFSIAQELKDVPAFRRYAQYNAYSEGWALYAESLAHEMGFYQDPYSEYGRLQNLMWRSIRLVVDTGVHSQHWSRQQMIDFFHQHTAMDEQNIETEVDRYIAWPGQALGYKLGEMTIVRMRAKARAKLEDKFDVKAFHDAVLGGGPMPLNILEQRLDAWLATQ